MISTDLNNVVLHFVNCLRTIFFATMVARKVASCNRSLETNFGIGEALRVFGTASKTRNANRDCHFIFLFHQQNARGLSTKINIAGSAFAS